MQDGFNPYLRIDVFAAAEDSPGELAQSQMLARLAERQHPDSTHIVYVLSHARRAACYIDIARDYPDILGVASDNLNRQLRLFGEPQANRLRLVWLEEFHDEVGARHRLAELRALPHAWQRRLIDQFNPEWLDLEELRMGFPFLRSVREDGATPFTPIRI
jgi:predicted GIY-YIG superfamily endonuclease